MSDNENILFGTASGAGLGASKTGTASQNIFMGNYSGNNIVNKKLLIDFIKKNFVKELKTFKNSIIVPLGNTVSSTISYLNEIFNLKLKYILYGFPHPSGLNIGKDKQFNNNKKYMLRVLRAYKKQ